MSRLLLFLACFRSSSSIFISNFLFEIFQSAMKPSLSYKFMCCNTSPKGKMKRQRPVFMLRMIKLAALGSARWDCCGVGRAMPIPRWAVRMWNIQPSAICHSTQLHLTLGALARRGGCFIQGNVDCSALLSRCYAEECPSPAESSTAALNIVLILMTAADLRWINP